MRWKQQPSLLLQLKLRGKDLPLLVGTCPPTGLWLLWLQWPHHQRHFPPPPSQWPWLHPVIWSPPPFQRLQLFLLLCHLLLQPMAPPDSTRDGIQQLFLKIFLANDFHCCQFDAYVIVFPLLHSLNFVDVIRLLTGVLEIFPMVLKLPLMRQSRNKARVDLGWGRACHWSQAWARSMVCSSPNQK